MDLRRRASTRFHQPKLIGRLLGVGLLGVLVIGIGIGASAATIPSGSSASRSVEADPTPANVLGGTGVVRWGTLYQQASGYERFAYVLVSRPDAKKAARLPGTTLVYKSGTSIQESWSTGVTYREALANGWLLKDASDAYLMNHQYGAFVGDIGNPAYQQRFIENTIAFLKRTKVDGVFIDDVLGDPRSMTSGVFPAKYPDSDAWESAMVSFVQKVGTALKSRGYYVLANATKWIADDQRSDTGVHAAEFWKRLAPGVSGLMSEFWLQAPDDHGQLRVLGSNWDQHWPAWQSLVSVAQNRGVDFFGLTFGPGSDTRAMRYGRGSFLLDWDGRGGAFLYYKTDHPNPYHPSWVRQLGKPLGPKLERDRGLWQRRFQQGMIVVNATNETTSVRVFGRSHSVTGVDALFIRAPRS